MCIIFYNVCLSSSTPCEMSRIKMLMLMFMFVKYGIEKLVKRGKHRKGKRKYWTVWMHCDVINHWFCNVSKMIDILCYRQIGLTI